MILLDQAGAARAESSIVAPPRHLAALVEHAFIQRHARRSPDSWRVVPDGHATIVVAASRRSARLRCTIVGPRSRFDDIDVRDRDATYGIRLHIGALPAITGCRASDFTDRSVPLETLDGPASRALVSRIDGEHRSALIFDALFAFVESAARGRTPAFGPDAFNGTRRVSDLGSRLGAPTRKTYERIVAEVGLSPKRLLRVQRLHHALLARSAGESWSHAAHGAGYADQPHLVREARQLLGETPAQWQHRSRPPIRSRRRGV